MKLKNGFLLGKKAVANLDSIIKSRHSTLLTKVHIVKAMAFPVVIFGCESWTMKKAECQRVDVFELWCSRRLENPFGSREIKPVNTKGNQLWIFIGRTDSEADVPILWPPDVKSWLIGNDPGAGKDWGQEEKGMTEDEMIRWHHQLNGHEFKQTPDIVKDREAWCAAAHGSCKEWLSDWTTTTYVRIV